jgi:hypothetical protein
MERIYIFAAKHAEISLLQHVPKKTISVYVNSKYEIGGSSK